ALALASLPAGSGAAALERASFDAFLAGFENGCDVGPAFAAFSSSVTNVKDGIGPLNVPRELRASIGALQMANHGEYTEYFLPANGTWHGLQVRGFEFFFGNNSGVNVMNVLFGESLANVRSVIGAKIDAEAARLAADPENFIQRTIELGQWKSGPALSCDQST
nr:hypothetical protein [Rhizobiaceae bacterium]